MRSLLSTNADTSRHLVKTREGPGSDLLVLTLLLLLHVLMPTIVCGCAHMDKKADSTSYRQALSSKIITVHMQSITASS